MIEVKENISLVGHSSFHIGGLARYFTIVKNEAEIMEAIAWSKEKKVEYKVIGGGSNLLFSDDGFNGLIVKYFGGEVSIKNDEVEVDAGVPLSLVLNKTLENGLSGLEWAIGIPGTIGGAVCNNAGAYGGEISENVESIKVLIEEEIKILKNKECGFGYRESFFKNGKLRGVIVSVKLKLKKVSDVELIKIKEKTKKILEDRLSKSPEGGSVGSTFRNIVLSEEEIKIFKEKFNQLPDEFVKYQKVPSAWLIEQCELRGKKIGGAMVSEKHAGKITNFNKATAKDVIMLISVVKQKVRSKFGLQLMEEFEYVGF